MVWFVTVKTHDIMTDFLAVGPIHVNDGVSKFVTVVVIFRTQSWLLTLADCTDIKQVTLAVGT